MPKQFDCRKMFICCREMLNKIEQSPRVAFYPGQNAALTPASALSGTASSACTPSRQTGSPPCQAARGETAPFAGTGTGMGQLYRQRIFYLLPHRLPRKAAALGSGL